MATLVLNSVGSALGGPVGGAIGALLGQQLDRRIFGGGRVEGPRLGDLSVQTSRYGAQVPAIYGRMRVAGSIVWATELWESETVSGAKGQPDRVDFSYSANFAVALSSRAKGEIGRIWADGKLLRGADGKLKVGGSMRLLDGGEAQEVDPLIASVEGDAPAYRDYLMVVFEGLELGEYGNRIPMLTFEILADGAIDAGVIMAGASGGLVEAEATKPIEGYAVHGGSIAAALRPLLEHTNARLVSTSGKLISPSVRKQHQIGERETEASSDGKAARRIESLLPANAVPSQLQVDYYDVERDYQAGRSRAWMPGGRVEREVDLPIAMTAAKAREWVEEDLQRRWRARRIMRLSLLPKFMDVRPGDVVLVNQTEWLVQSTDVTRFAVEIEAVSHDGTEPSHSLPSDPGRVNSGTDSSATRTEIGLFEMPDMDGSATPMLAIAAANAGPGWRSVPLDVDFGGLEQDRSSAARESILGRIDGDLNSGSARLIDDANSFVVRLVDPGQSLISVSDEALLGGANLALVGRELLQFGRVEPLGGGRYRLSRLLRARRGTEWAMYQHTDGQAFALLDRARLAMIRPGIDQVGASLRVRPQGLPDDDAETSALDFLGEALRPLSPVKLVAHESGNAIELSWVRRSRKGYHWNDGVEVALGESVERYRVEIAGSDGSAWFDTVEPSLSVPLSALGDIGNRPFTIDVRMVGDVAVSFPAETAID